MLDGRERYIYTRAESPTYSVVELHWGFVAHLVLKFSVIIICTSPLICVVNYRPLSLFAVRFCCPSLSLA
jgi:hypothetical protein